MPLYRNRPKKQFFSQEAPAAKVTSAFKQPSSSQKAVEDVLQIYGKMRSPIHPEEFSRTASEPDQSAFADFRFENGRSRMEETTPPDGFETGTNGDWKQASFGTESENPQQDRILQEIAGVDNSDISSLSAKNNEISLNDKFLKTKQEGKNIKTITRIQGKENRNYMNKKSNNPKCALTKDEKKKLIDLKKERSEDDIFSQNSVPSKSIDVPVDKYSEDLDISLNSSISSQLSLNSSPIKEAYKKFLLQKEMKRIENENSMNKKSNSPRCAKTNNKKKKLMDSKNLISSKSIDVTVSKYSENLDVSLNSSISSQISLNSPPVKEAYKKFLLQKEMKRMENENSMNKKSNSQRCAQTNDKKRKLMDSKQERLEHDIFSKNSSISSQMSLNSSPVKEAYKKFLLQKEIKRMENGNSMNKESNSQRCAQTNYKKKELMDSKEKKSEDGIFSKNPTSSKSKDVPVNKYSEDLDISLNSSISSHLSLNSSPVKEAYKKFLLQKEAKREENLRSSQNLDISLNDAIVPETYSQVMRKRDKFARINTPKGLTHYEKMKWLQEQRIVGLYVFCDRCDKMRYLEEIHDPTLLPDKWYCEDNKDTLHNKCEIPEENIPIHVQDDLIENLYNAGSIVWAKVDGYPWWPAMVDDDPDNECYYWLDDDINNIPSHYHVTFFDRKVVARDWLKPNRIKSFHKEKNNLNVLPKKYRHFKTRIDFAIKQANEALKMTLRERFEKFSFLERRKSLEKPKEVSGKLKEETSKYKRGKRSKFGGQTRKKSKTVENKKIESCDFLMGDSKIPNSPTIENISLELFENIQI